MNKVFDNFSDALGVREFLEKNWEVHSLPFKKNRLDHLKFYSSGEERLLKQEWKKLRCFYDFILKTERTTEIRGILKKIPDPLSSLYSNEKTVLDIFIIKRFLTAYRDLSLMVAQTGAVEICLGKYEQKLLQYLSIDSENDFFSVSSSYSPGLKKIRDKIRLNEIKLEEIKDSFRNLLSAELGFQKNIDQDSFTIDPDNHIYKKAMKSKKLYLSDSSGVFEIRFPAAVSGLQGKIQEYKKCARIIEKQVLLRISCMIDRKREKLIMDFKFLQQWENYFSRAEMMVKLQCTIPEKFSNAPSVIQGFFLPLKQKLENEGLCYTPLDISISKNANVITGSNMGGKTQILKTAGFLQVLFQLGFGVPATFLSSRLFDKIVYISSESAGSCGGLSSFGTEISQLGKLIENDNGKTLFLVDEFSRTTNISEAIALNYALIRWFLHSESLLLLTTHLDLLPSHTGADHFCTGGIRSRELLLMAQQAPVTEKLCYLQKAMDYSIRKNPGVSVPREGIMVARAVGFPEKILADALFFMENILHEN